MVPKPQLSRVDASEELNIMSSLAVQLSVGLGSPASPARQLKVMLAGQEKVGAVTS